MRVPSTLAAAPDGEVCVWDFVGPLGKSQPAVSHHLKILGGAGLVHGWASSLPGPTSSLDATMK
ncbi:MAG: ArsR family transcriptional regulator [Acidimicrobiales bacterium]